MFYQLITETKFSVGVGMLDDSDGLVTAGQIFANSHPDWGPVETRDLPHLDDELLAHYEVKPDR